MNRPLLKEENVSSDALAAINAYHPQVVSEVSSAVAKNNVVIVGMGSNPFVKKARKALNEAGIEFTYIEYGNYFSQWKQRLAIKLWSGWPTYPQVFVKGKLVGGFKETHAALKNGSLTK